MQMLHRQVHLYLLNFKLLGTEKNRKTFLHLPSVFLPNTSWRYDSINKAQDSDLHISFSTTKYDFQDVKLYFKQIVFYTSHKQYQSAFNDCINALAGQ